MKSVIKKLFNQAGLDIVRLGNERKLGYELEDEATECIQIIKDHTMLPKERLVTLYQQVSYCEKNRIPGCYVECGVWKGGAIGLMALANLNIGRERRQIHLFDAFQEICEPDAVVDGEQAIREVELLTGRKGQYKGTLEPVHGIYNSLGGPGTLAENQKLLEEVINYPEEFISYHVGWFQDTLPSHHEQIGQIAILRLDGDWYASTKVCLDYLFDKVAKGGVVIIDDYGVYEGCRRAVDEFIAQKQITAYLAPVDSVCRFFIKQ
tara:strand:- start:166 stop:957 length:792 start_codon:yes stop_codon:yes gene_type:complete